MMRFIEQILTLAMRQPRALFAALAGLLLSWGITQTVKFWLPEKWSKKGRELAIQGVAFTSGFSATLAIWGSATGKWVDSIVAACIVGLLAPALWNIAMFGLSMWRPRYARALSRSRECDGETYEGE